MSDSPTPESHPSPAPLRNPRMPWIHLRPRDLPPTVLQSPTETPCQLPTGGRIRRWHLRDPEVVATSWRSQMLLVDDGRVRIRLQAQLDIPPYGGVQADQPVVTPWPLRELLVIGSVVGGVATFAEEMANRRRNLREHLHSFYVNSREGWLVDRHHRWAEPAVVAVGPRSGIPDWRERVVDRCREMTIDRVVRIVDGRWDVLDLYGSDIERVSSDPCTITRDTVRPCPMLDRPDAGEYCRMVGGPWIQRSQEAAVMWRRRWRELNASVGCDTCDGRRYVFMGEVREGGGPMELSVDPVPTRWLEGR